MTAINTAEDRQTIYNKLKEIGNCLTRAKDERDAIKDILDELHEQFPDITKKQFRRLAKFLNEQTIETEIADFTEIEILYKSVVGGIVNE